jgi:hypothetical protein
MATGPGEWRAGPLLHADMRQGAMSVAHAASPRQFVNPALPHGGRSSRP